MLTTLEKKKTLLNTLPAWNNPSLGTIISNTCTELEQRFKPYKFRECWDGFPLALATIDIGKEFYSPFMDKMAVAKMGYIAVYDTKCVLYWDDKEYYSKSLSCIVDVFENLISSSS